ncbi:2-hydroxyacid dehydrogenase [Neobacillus soli]|uniref:2-hydroxyacid dehydrogenase n=1 Tax=Neobacillus soli TaxID=220688 RepID=UPI000B05FEAE|nr:2-hydroxyacid dehydrogenase [Neobacillus soli]
MKILITAPYNQKARDQLEDQIGEVVYHSWKDNGQTYSTAELVQLLKETEAEGLITELDQVTEDVLKEVPSLRFIGVCRGTPSNVDVNAATERGIPVFYTPARNAQAVAEMFVANLITFLRNTIPAVTWTKEGKWNGDPLTSYLHFKGNELAGKTIGMVGFGAVGQRIAGLVQGFPCNIQFYDPYVQNEHPDYKQTTLEEIFTTSDIVSIHLPVTEQTKGMINHNLIALMKGDSILVNTARAVVVEREALRSALKENKIRGAILDVFYHEPPDEIDWEMMNLPNVLATPHIAGATFEVEDHHAAIMNEAIMKWTANPNVPIKSLFNKSILHVKS